MKKVIFGLGCICITTAFGQGGQPKEIPSRGPYNVLPNGVIDGIVLKEEVPVRQAVVPEFVREADLVWSKRVFSRIDSRERINHDIFFPFDNFDGDPTGGSIYNPLTKADIDNPSWNKNQQRWSLWTIILRHIMLGDLTVYQVASPDYPVVEDGFSFKYPINKISEDDYFTSSSYRANVNKVITSRAKGKEFQIEMTATGAGLVPIMKTNQTLQQFIDSLKSDKDVADMNKDIIDMYTSEPQTLQRYWDNGDVGFNIPTDDIVSYIGSNHILAYNIKEDWFFDKERSMLDRRIIAIAPVARYSYKEQKDPTEPKERGKLLVMDLEGSFFEGQDKYTGPVEELEMFWLYFPELRNVLVNYYVYNDQNDAQWMSMDDLFWKRKFNSTIYKVSDKFDREIQEYKYGVDALYEAERIKEEIRKWEHDLWNF
ncbi:MAG: gliding motility protein GldN [Crocinitomicaceae bacterium]|jgi:hypothetical protein